MKPIQVPHHIARAALAGGMLLALLAITMLLQGQSALAAQRRPTEPFCGTPAADGATKPCGSNATPLPKPSPLPAGCFQNLTCVTAYADGAVALRLQALNDAIQRANTNKCLDDKQRAPITAQLQDGVSGVRKLQAAFDAETDPKAIKTDLQQLFAGFAIFSLVLPRAFSEMALDCQVNALALFKSGVDGVQTAIDNAAKAGKDVTGERQLFADMQSQLGDAQTQIANATTLLASANLVKGDLGAVKQDLGAVTKDLEAARQDLAGITVLLSGKSQGPASTPRPKPTGVPGTPSPKP